MKSSGFAHLTSDLVLYVYGFKIMIRLIRIHLKMWVQVAVLTELHQKNQFHYTGIGFLVCVVSIIIDGLKEICFFVV